MFEITATRVWRARISWLTLAMALVISHLPQSLRGEEEGVVAKKSGKFYYTSKIEEFETLGEAIISLRMAPQLDAGDFAKQLDDLFRETLRMGEEAREKLQNAHPPKIAAYIYNSMLNKGTIHAMLPGIGRGEPNIVDGQIFPKVVHNRSEISVLFLDTDLVKQDSEHLAQIIARQKIDAGQSRTDGERGRDVLIIWYDRTGPAHDTDIVSVDYLPRAKSKWSKDYWQDWWKATYKDPSKGDNYLAVYCAAMQACLALGIAAYKLHTGQAHEFFWQPAVQSAAFGGVIGRWVSFYRNWKTRGPMWWQYTKSSSISIIYALVLLAWTDKPITASYIAFNVGANNMAKVEWENNSTIRSKMWLNQKNLTIKVPEKWLTYGINGPPQLDENGLPKAEIRFIRMSKSAVGAMSRMTVALFPRLKTGIETPINQASFEAQNWFLVPFTLRLAGLLGLKVAGLPAGDILLVLSIPAAMLMNLKYAHKHNFSGFEKLRLDYEKSIVSLASRLTVGSVYKLGRFQAASAYNLIRGGRELTDADPYRHLEWIGLQYSKAKYAPLYYTGRSMELLSSVFVGRVTRRGKRIGERLPDPRTVVTSVLPKRAPFRVRYEGNNFANCAIDIMRLGRALKRPYEKAISVPDPEWRLTPTPATR